MDVLRLLLGACFFQVCLGVDVHNISPRYAFVKAKNPLIHSRIFNDIGNIGKQTLFIVNGTKAVAGQFPFQVALDVSINSQSSFCGGSLITQSYVLTAAHCVFNADGVTVLLGALDLLDPNNPTGQVQISVKASSITVHPNFTTDNYYNDIAVINLQQAVSLSDTIGVVSLPSVPADQNGSGQLFTESGWGKTSDDGEIVSTILSYGRVPFLNNKPCKKWFWDNAEYPIIGTQMCTETPQGQSTCRGDSGGPVTIQNTDGSFTQVGIISLGLESCEIVGAPNIHTDLYQYVSFVKANTDYKG